MSKYDTADKAALGSIIVSVSDDGRPVVGAYVSIHRAHESVKDPGEFDCAKWDRHVDRYVKSLSTGDKGTVVFENLPPAHYVVDFEHLPEMDAKCVSVHAGCLVSVCFEVQLCAQVEVRYVTDDCKAIPCPTPRVGDQVIATIKFAGPRKADKGQFGVIPPPDVRTQSGTGAGRDTEYYWTIPSAGSRELDWRIQFPLRGTAPRALAGVGPATLALKTAIFATDRAAQMVGGKLDISLQRTSTPLTDDVSFWQGIINGTEQLSFNRYLSYMDYLFCGEPLSDDIPAYEQSRIHNDKRNRFEHLKKRRLLPFTDSDAYRVVKAATEAFVMVNCNVLPQKGSSAKAPTQPFDHDRDQGYLARRDIPFPAGGLEDVFGKAYLEQIPGGPIGAKTLPYLAVIRRKLPDVDIKLTPFEADLPPGEMSKCYGIVQEKLTNPCLLELIWSYWHEEGMLVQTINAITRRFQNMRGPSAQDPLANLEIDPLRSLNNLLWGYVQDEQHRLTVVRRNYEYDHHYGMRLDGRAVQGTTPADSRSKFLEAFHNLLRICSVFFKQDDDTTVKADAFPVLNALKEVHLILTQGQHNQFGDLPSTARIEMLMQQWLLARPEFREFLPTRISVAYPEPWMDRVDAMKKIQGWTDTSVLHFRNLGMFGEQILLPIRWGFWSDVQEPLQAFNWARMFRPQIQGYIHAYRAATGVDLAADSADAQVDATMPSALLKKRLAAQPRA